MTHSVQAEIRAVVGDDLPFSDVPGFLPNQFDFRCPDTGLPCGSKLRLISQYTRDIDEAAVERGDAALDVRKLNLKLREYAGWTAFGVECIESGTCMVRKAMDESETRQTAVKTFRGIRGWFRSLTSECESEGGTV